MICIMVDLCVVKYISRNLTIYPFTYLAISCNCGCVGVLPWESEPVLVSHVMHPGDSTLLRGAVLPVVALQPCMYKMYRYGEFENITEISFSLRTLLHKFSEKIISCGKNYGHICFYTISVWKGGDFIFCHWSMASQNTKLESRPRCETPLFAFAGLAYEILHCKYYNCCNIHITMIPITNDPLYIPNVANFHCPCWMAAFSQQKYSLISVCMHMHVVFFYKLKLWNLIVLMAEFNSLSPGEFGGNF